MTQEHPHSSDPRLELYLDGALSAEDRRAFEAELAASADLRAQLSLQSRLDSSLRTLFAEPDSLAAPAPIQIQRRGARRRPLLLLAAAASIALALSVVWIMVEGFLSAPAAPASRIVATAPLTLRDQYRLQLAGGFKPEIVCTTHEAFGDWTARALKERIAPTEVPPSVQFVGWSYSPLMSAYTGVLLARVESEPVVVFMDRAEHRAGRPNLDQGPGGEHIFEHTLGDIVMYEVSPFAEPRVLPLLELQSR